MAGAFLVDWNERFPRLAKPPIVEAVIHWQARAQNWPEPELLRALLNEKFPDNSSISVIHEFGMLTKLTDNEDPVIQKRRHGMTGYRLTSNDEKTIVQFKRDGLSYSRTNSYERWESFIEEAQTAWRIFQDIAAPVETKRLGVRFINHFPNATAQTLDCVLRDPPTCPSNLPLKEFVYQSTCSVPEQPFNIRIIKVMQEQTPSLEVQPSSGLFLDCDVYTTKPMANGEAASEANLTKMRWLKNKVFFTLLAENAVK